MSACVFGHPKITLPLRLFVKESRDSSEPASDSLEEVYREQIMDAMKIESERRIHETHDPDEIARLEALSLVELTKSDNPDLVPALMARLGTVRA